MSDHEKVRAMQQVCARLDDETVAHVDAYVRAREREARVPLSRSIGLRELVAKGLAAWASEQRVDGVDNVDGLSTRQHK